MAYSETYLRAFAATKEREIAAARKAFNWRMEDDPRPLDSDEDCLVSLCASRAVQIAERDEEIRRLRARLRGTI